MRAFQSSRRRVLIGVLAATSVAAGLAHAARATAPTPPLDLRAAEAAELRVGDSERRVWLHWGTPAAIARPNGVRTLTYGFDGGTLTVAFERGRVRAVVVRGSIRTTKGDRVGTSLTTFRERWGGSVHRGCCAVGVRHVRLTTGVRGVVFVATFRDRRLREIALTTDRLFRACFVAECD